MPPPGEAKPDWWIVSEVAKRLGFGAAFDFNSAADIFREHAGAVGVRERRQPRFRHRRLERRCRTRRSTRWRRCNGRCATANWQPQARFFADGGFYANDRKARFVAPEIPALRTETTRVAAAAPQHRPHPRPVAHHDPHRPEPAARPASAGAVRRDPSRRCRQNSASRDGGFARVTTDYGQCTLQGRGQRAAAARHAVRADPLERRERVRRARRRAGGAVHRSVLRPAREQGDAGLDHALRICLPRLCAVAPSHSNCPSMPGGRGSRSAAATAICSPTTPISRDGNPGCARSPAMMSPNTRILAAASIARRRLPATASRPACSSVPRAMPATGTWSRACSRRTR